MQVRAKTLIGAVVGLAAGLVIGDIPMSHAQSAGRTQGGNAALPPTFRVGNSFVLPVEMPMPRGWEAGREVVVVEVWGEWVQIDQGKADPVWFRPAAFPVYFVHN